MALKDMMTQEMTELPWWAVSGELRGAAWGTLPLRAALLTLTRYQEDQERAAADLLDREVWMLQAMEVATRTLGSSTFDSCCLGRLPVAIPCWGHVGTHGLCAHTRSEHLPV